ncbi:MAG: B12-binding domain-containing protein [Treponema sp.]|jgi:methanogenic corrinoid protein MtbC1|nr:B12-binding domain-containing protein [Treponema sp.]
MVNLSDIAQRLQAGKAGETADLIAKALEENYSVESILRQALIPGMRAVASRYKRKEIFQPEMLIAERAMNWGIETLRSSLACNAEKLKGAVVIGIVKGDIRDYEKSLMAIALESKFLRVIDLGSGVEPERFVETAVMEKARLIICTANLPCAMGQLKLVVHAASSSGVRGLVTIMATGAPVTEKYCRDIGADCYARDALAAAEIAESIFAKT